MGRDILKSSLKNASFSIILQVVFRCVTFILNAFILRYVGRNVLGVINVRLLLLDSTIIFLSREPFIRACISPTKGHKWPQLINQIWLTVPVSIGLSGIFLYIWLNVLPSVDNELLTQYRNACFIVSLSCLIELLAQSAVLIGQMFCFVKLKVMFDAAQLIVRTVIFAGLTIYDKDKAIIAFSIGQIFGACTIFFGYYIYFHWYITALNKYRSKNTATKNEKEHSSFDKNNQKLFENMDDFRFKSVFEFLPFVITNKESVFNEELSTLTASFAKQSAVKLLLTEGEKYVMSISPILTFSDQATYDVVNNLGSLAARFIFRPIEDSGYFYFTQMIKRNENLNEQDLAKTKEAAQVLGQLCKGVTSIGLIILTFGQSYSGSFLLMYAGKDFINDGLPITLLQCHCFAIVLLAINGVTECFSFATMNSQKLDRYNYLLVLFSVVFLGMSYVLTIFFGAIGFIFANCLNMLARILHSMLFIRDMFRYTDFNPLREILPGPFFICILIIALIITKISEYKFFPDNLVIHICNGGLCFLFTILILVFENRKLLKSGFEKFVRKSASKEKVN